MSPDSILFNSIFYSILLSVIRKYSIFSVSAGHILFCSILFCVLRIFFCSTQFSLCKTYSILCLQKIFDSLFSFYSILLSHPNLF